MGLGKTIQTISLITYLMEKKNNNGPFLIIVPLSTLENWFLEFNRWAPHIKVVKYVGNKTSRTKIQKEILKSSNFNVLLIQYEFITRDQKYLKKVKWDYIINQLLSFNFIN